jgi:hypothetical protein
MPAAYRDARMAPCTHCRRLMPLADNGTIGWHFTTTTGRALTDLCPGSMQAPDPGRC